MHRRWKEFAVTVSLLPLPTLNWDVVDHGSLWPIVAGGTVFMVALWWSVAERIVWQARLSIVAACLLAALTLWVSANQLAFRGELLHTFYGVPLLYGGMAFGVVGLTVSPYQLSWKNAAERLYWGIACAFLYGCTFAALGMVGILVLGPA